MRIIILLLFTLPLSAQLPPSGSQAIKTGNTSPKVDSTRIYSVSLFQEMVLKNHPIVRQAKLLSAAARADVFQALGKFDPLLESA
ncbi:MAG: hypothetical protein EOO38_20840, partial [Cytophagaceae bacterium]